MKSFKQWIKSTGIKTIKTMAETAIALIGTNTMGIIEVDWIGVLSASLLAGLITFLTCIKSLSDIKEGD